MIVESRFILVRDRTVVLDKQTGERWHIPKELLRIIDYRFCEVRNDPKSPPDPIPLAESVRRGDEVMMTKYNYHRWRPQQIERKKRRR